jgi:hypothetical protein
VYGPALVSLATERRVRCRTRMINVRFENPGKCSSMKNIAPDPGGCTT